MATGGTESTRTRLPECPHKCGVHGPPDCPGEWRAVPGARCSGAALPYVQDSARACASLSPPSFVPWSQELRWETGFAPQRVLTTACAGTAQRPQDHAGDKVPADQMSHAHSTSKDWELVRKRHWPCS